MWTVPHDGALPTGCFHATLYTCSLLCHTGPTHGSLLRSGAHTVRNSAVLPCRTDAHTLAPLKVEAHLAYEPGTVGHRGSFRAYCRCFRVGPAHRPIWTGTECTAQSCDRSKSVSCTAMDPQAVVGLSKLERVPSHVAKQLHVSTAPVRHVPCRPAVPVRLAAFPQPQAGPPPRPTLPILAPACPRSWAYFCEHPPVWCYSPSVKSSQRVHSSQPEPPRCPLPIAGHATCLALY